jgi:hypothetical protein
MLDGLIQKFRNEAGQTIMAACQTMTDAELYQLAGELADATDIVQQYVKGDHPEMYDLHTTLDDISADFFEKAEKAK